VPTGKGSLRQVPSRRGSQGVQVLQLPKVLADVVRLERSIDLRVGPVVSYRYPRASRGLSGEMYATRDFYKNGTNGPCCLGEVRKNVGWTFGKP